MSTRRPVRARHPFLDHSGPLPFAHRGGAFGGLGRGGFGAGAGRQPGRDAEGLAGRFALQLHRSLQAEFADAPSAPLFEGLMRMAGLLHDVGHGPFGHFFDDNFLADFDLTHEKVGQRIIREELGDLIRGLRRSPSGPRSSQPAPPAPSLSRGGGASEGRPAGPPPPLLSPMTATGC